jgi:uncharacterized membrane protein YphA (DoxX/SURF4 family)
MTHTHFLRPTGATTTGAARLGDGAHQAYLLLRTVFVVAPILFGLDKFFGVMTNWDKYLVPWINDIVPGDAHQAMLIVGVIEIVAGILVALRPRIGAFVVSLWLVGIMVDLLTLGGYGDVALRDFGLFVASLALGLLAWSPAASAQRAEGVR